MMLEDDPPTAAAMRAAAERWLTWRAAEALAAWRESACAARRARSAAGRADAHRREALALRALVGFGLTAREAAARRAAEAHWARATKEAVVRTWAEEVWQSKVRRGEPILPSSTDAVSGAPMQRHPRDDRLYLPADAWMLLACMRKQASRPINPHAAGCRPQADSSGLHVDPRAPAQGLHKLAGARTLQEAAAAARHGCAGVQV